LGYPHPNNNTVEKEVKIMKHEVYTAIVEAVKQGKIIEPFSKEDFHKVCTQFAEGTHNNFLRKHRKGNGKTSELFDENSSTKTYRLIRPFKYGL
jgi:hypothetical protein